MELSCFFLRANRQCSSCEFDLSLFHVNLILRSLIGRQHDARAMASDLCLFLLRWDFSTFLSTVTCTHTSARWSICSVTRSIPVVFLWAPSPRYNRNLFPSSRKDATPIESFLVLGASSLLQTWIKRGPCIQFGPPQFEVRHFFGSISRSSFVKSFVFFCSSYSSFILIKRVSEISLGIRELSWARLHGRRIWAVCFSLWRWDP
jgi:hypothetical protein